MGESGKVILQVGIAVFFGRRQNIFQVKMAQPPLEIIGPYPYDNVTEITTGAKQQRYHRLDALPVKLTLTKATKLKNKSKPFLISVVLVVQWLGVKLAIERSLVRLLAGAISSQLGQLISSLRGRQIEYIACLHGWG